MQLQFQVPGRGSGGSGAEGIGGEGSGLVQVLRSSSGRFRRRAGVLGKVPVQSLGDAYGRFQVQ